MLLAPLTFIFFQWILGFDQVGIFHRFLNSLIPQYITHSRDARNSIVICRVKENVKFTMLTLFIHLLPTSMELSNMLSWTFYSRICAPQILIINVHIFAGCFGIYAQQFFGVITGYVLWGITPGVAWGWTLVPCRQNVLPTYWVISSTTYVYNV